MTGFYCVISRSLVIFLMFTTLPRKLHGKVHRCLREFDPSNCNALEEVWAYDADEGKCIEVVYGGCGRPQHLSNRFETLEDCMQSCEIFAKSPSGANKKEAYEADDDSDRERFVFTNPLKFGRAAIVGHQFGIDSASAIENIRGVVEHLGDDNAQQSYSSLKQITPNPSQNYWMPSIVGLQPLQMYQQNPGGFVYAKTYYRQQPIIGSFQGPSPYWPFYGGYVR